MHFTLGASIYRPQSLGPENEAKDTDFEKPKISALITPSVMVDVADDVATLLVQCRGSTFGVVTLNLHVHTMSRLWVSMY